MTSSVSVMSWPIFTMRSAPQHDQRVGASITTRSRGTLSWFANKPLPGNGCSGKGLRRGLLARERAHRAVRFDSGLLGRQRVLGCCRLQFLKLQFQLIDQTSPAFGGDAVCVTA
jgi:hypothetical protein